VDRQIKLYQVVVLIVFEIYSIAAYELRIGKSDNAFVDWFVNVSIELTSSVL